MSATNQHYTSRPALLACSILLITPILSGCTYVLHPYNAPVDETIRIVSPRPEEFSIRVDNDDRITDYKVGSNGIVSFHVPRLPRGCAVYFLDTVKISDHRSEGFRAINLTRGERVVRKLSLNDLAKLPLGNGGVRELKTH
jgi:hypothetical protein